MGKDKKSLLNVDACPGAENIRKPKPEYHKCPSCGAEVEIWTDELKATCGKCGQNVLKDEAMSCILWCEHAEKCVGSEKYRKIMGSKE
jgi:ribosomal protein S27AE